VVSGVAPETRGKEKPARIAVAPANFAPFAARNPAGRRIEPAGGGCYHGYQCPWQLPPQQPPRPPPDWQAGEESLPPPAEAKVENFLSSFVEPQCGHFVPFQSDERTRISLSRSHFPQ